MVVSVQSSDISKGNEHACQFERTLQIEENFIICIYVCVCVYIYIYIHIYILFFRIFLSECRYLVLVTMVFLFSRSRAMQLISVEQLCTLLKFALNRLKTMPGVSFFFFALSLGNILLYYPTLTCEYNIALILQYCKENSPEFATL